MARKARLDVSGGFYHVLARGNRRATIFHDREDYSAYLEWSAWSAIARRWCDAV